MPEDLGSDVWNGLGLDRAWGPDWEWDWAWAWEWDWAWNWDPHWVRLPRDQDYESR